MASFSGMRARIAVAAYVLACLGCLALGVWLIGEQRAPARAGEAAKVLAEFETKEPAAFEIDLAARYGGRLELLDPRRILPTWQKHAAKDAIATHVALRDCGEPSVFVSDPELAKAMDWHAAGCAHATPLLLSLAEQPPFIHPAGGSYAHRLLEEHAPSDPSHPSDAWLTAHERAFHVLELRDLPPTLLTADEHALSELPSATFARVLEGDATVLSHAWIMHVSRDQHGPTMLSLRPRADWESFAERAGVALGPASGFCAEPASPILCWKNQPTPAPHRTTARALLGAFAVMTTAGVALLLALIVRGRREAEKERVFLLRTLTHELRSPVTAMRLDLEPLRASFDALPESCQEPMLRLSEGVERLSRVLEVTGRALSLFDRDRGERASPISAREVPSVNEYFEELREEWPEDVELDPPEKDRAFVTDPDWLRVAVKNLVENATKHGEGAVRVEVRFVDDRDELSVRVQDKGKTPALVLGDVTRPFQKGEGSAGLGLGLSLVQRIVERQGGRLRHEPDPTTFEIRMPQGKNQ